ncbi:hypothetical protein AWN76_005475 [Rhodothermaceae bacterium RA]|nr:hypothetical protein AWN76_005475 [Rhodothermaceae bacterium RA]
MRLRLLCLLLVVLASGCQSGTERAPYPARPITFIVPWNAGGGTDTVSRALAAVLQERLGVPVNVVNRTGGGGVVGHLGIAQASPDGYTLGAVTVEITMMHWTGLTELTVDDYTPVALVTNNPASVTVAADAPWDTLGELLADVEAHPGDYLASGTSKGGVWDLARIGMLRAAGLPESALPWVPSQGAAPALQELLAGGVQVVTVALAETDALRKAGQVKVLGVMAEERLPGAPDVPTLKEQGLDWSIGGWMVVSGPAGLPEAVRQTLREALQDVTSDPAYRAPLEQAGFNLLFVTGEELAAFLVRQDQVNGELLALAGMVP